MTYHNFFYPFFILSLEVLGDWTTVYERKMDGAGELVRFKVYYYYLLPLTKSDQALRSEGSAGKLCTLHPCKRPFVASKMRA